MRIPDRKLPADERRVEYQLRIHLGAAHRMRALVGCDGLTLVIVLKSLNNTGRLLKVDDVSCLQMKVVPRDYALVLLGRGFFDFTGKFSEKQEE